MVDISDTAAIVAERQAALDAATDPAERLALASRLDREKTRLEAKARPVALAENKTVDEVVAEQIAQARPA